MAWVVLAEKILPYLCMPNLMLLKPHMHCLLPQISFYNVAEVCHVLTFHGSHGVTVVSHRMDRQGEAV